MQIPTWLGWLDPVIRAATDWLTSYGQPLLFGAGATGAALAMLVLWRFLTRGEVHAKLGVVAVGLATLFAMEGMYEVAHGPLGLNAAGSLIFCATFEVVMLHQGSLAAHKLAANASADVSRHMRFVWGVSVVSGVIASTASDGVTEVVLRLATPPLAAAIWYMSLYADKPTPQRQPSSWIWTPRRIGIHLGLIQPGEQDLVAVDRDRRIHRLTVTSHRLHHGAGWLAGWRRSKLRRLAIHADEDMVREAQRRIARVHRIEKLTSPDAAPVGEVSDRERELLDEVRLIMRQATTTLRREHQVAFGPAQPAAQIEPVREIAGIRMPAHIADQIPAQVPAGWAARHRPTALPNRAVRELPNPPAPVLPNCTPPNLPNALPNSGTPAQSVSRASVPAERPAPVRQTTVRVDRMKPVSPAAGGEIPPRIRDMVRDLKRTYRGEIPGRADVMKRLGWTSNGDASTAIRLVREERAAKTTKEN